MIAVYTITNTVNGKFYLGSSVQIGDRWKAHLTHLEQNRHHSQAMQRAWNKYGSEAFHFTVVKVFKSEEGLREFEQHCLDTLPCHYNTSKKATFPSWEGRKHKPESIEKMRAAAVGRKMHPNCVAALKERAHTPQANVNRAAAVAKTLKAKQAEGHTQKPAALKGWETRRRNMSLRTEKLAF